MLKNVYSLFKVVVILNLLVCLINREWTATFICLFNVLLFYVSDFVKMKLNYNNFFQILIYIFLLGSLLGGEVYFLYSKIWYFDIILHLLSSFILSGLCFYTVKSFEINVNTKFFMLFIFSFAMMVASLWEITEFSVDRLFGADMQKDTVINEINSIFLSDEGDSIVNKKINSMTIGDYTINGYLDIGLYDTIEDMMCAVVGSFLFLILGKVKLLF